MDKRLRTWMAATAGVAVVTCGLFAVTTWQNPWRFLALSLFVESVLVLVVLGVVAVLSRWLGGTDVRRAGPPRASDGPEQRTTPPRECRAA